MNTYIQELIDLNKKIIIKSYTYKWYAILNNYDIMLYNINNDSISCYKILLNNLIKLINDDDKIKIKYSLYYKDDNTNIINIIENIKKHYNKKIIISYKICYN